MAHKVLVADPIHKDGIEVLQGSSMIVNERYDLSKDDLAKAVSDCSVLIVRGRTKVTEEVMKAGKVLKIVARAGVGLDNINLQAAEKLKIHVISTPTAPTVSVAELVIGLILAVLRRIPYADSALKEGKWVKSELAGNELRGKTLGVIGAAGRIGIEVARIAKEGFGTGLVGYDVIEFREKARELGMTATRSVQELLSSSDIVTIHVPYLPSTHHLINDEKLSTVKRGIILINTSRGDVVDGQALLKGLKDGRVGGAGLDVFHSEPPTEPWEKELVSFGKGTVVTTCHIGAQTNECQRLESRLVAEEVVNRLR